MSYLNKYINNLTNDNSSYLRQARIDDSKFIVSLTFKESPNYYRASSLSDECFYDIQITESTDSRDEKTLIAPFDSAIHLGSLVFWQDNHWIVNHFDSSMGDIYKRGKIRKCNSSLKWLNESGDIVEAFFCYESDTSPGLGINEGQVISMADTRRDIIIAKNVETEKIALQNRFIFDGRVWDVVKYDRIKTEGLIYLTVKVSQTDSANDNMELRIADYWNNIHTYSISILNGATATVNLGDTLQLIVETKDIKNGATLPSILPVTHTSSDLSIATVSSTGLVETLSDGDVTLTVSLTDHPEVFTSILLSISNEVVNNYTVMVTGADICNVGRTQPYTVVIYNNSKPDITKIVVWSLMNDAMSGTTDLAQITSQTGNSCVVKGLKYSSPQTTASFVRLVATCDEIEVVGNKRINIKSLI